MVHFYKRQVFCIALLTIRPSKLLRDDFCASIKSTPPRQRSTRQQIHCITKLFCWKFKDWTQKIAVTSAHFVASGRQIVNKLMWRRRRGLVFDLCSFYAQNHVNARTNIQLIPLTPKLLSYLPSLGAGAVNGRKERRDSETSYISAGREMWPEYSLHFTQ